MSSLRAMLQVCQVGLTMVAAAGMLPAADGYLVHNLVSDIPGLADQFDKNLVNPWGKCLQPDQPLLDRR